MTTTITVKARAHGAVVSLRAKHNAANASEFEIPANTSRDFHIDADHRIEVAQGQPTAGDSTQPSENQDEPEEDSEV